MNKTSISGWQDVLSFTFKQTMKSKAFLVSFVIFVLLASASMPIVTYITADKTEDPNAPINIQKVYINNEATLPDLNFDTISDESAFSQVTFETMAEDFDTVSNRIEAEENTSIILTVSISNGYYALDFVKASNGPVGNNEMTRLGNAILEQFNLYKLNSLGITDEQSAMLNATIDTKVSMIDVSGEVIEKEDTTISFAEYWFIYGIWFIVLMVNSIASAQIASSIVTEKSTKVMEYLLTSVKPLALIVGKIIAMLAAVLIEMATLVIMVFVSNKVSGAVIAGNGEDVISKYLPSNIFSNLNIANVIFCILFVLLGLIFYATLAGLAGSTVSRMEELQEGLTLFTMTNLVGAYIAMGAANVLMASGTNAFATFAFLFPLSSPFLVPGAILVGKISLPLAAASFALLIVFNILLFMFVAKVFETLILHNGNKIKVKELIKLSKI